MHYYHYKNTFTRHIFKLYLLNTKSEHIVKRIIFLFMSRGEVEDIRLEAKAQDTKKFRGREQTLSRPRPRNKDTSASVLKKKVFKNFFQAKKVFKSFVSGNLYLTKPKKKDFADFPQGFWRFPIKFQRFKNSAVPSLGQGNFRGLETSRPRTSTCVLEDVLKAKNVLEDSTSVHEIVIIFVLSNSILINKQHKYMPKFIIKNDSTAR